MIQVDQEEVAADCAAVPMQFDDGFFERAAVGQPGHAVSACGAFSQGERMRQSGVEFTEFAGVILVLELKGDHLPQLQVQSSGKP